MKFYVASGLENRERVKLVINKLYACGHEMAYDWTLHGDVRERGEEVLQTVAFNETAAVACAECVLILLPGGRGTHTELGIALATRASKRILLWSATGDEFGGGGRTCAFYHHSAVERICCTFDELLKLIETL